MKPVDYPVYKPGFRHRLSPRTQIRVPLSPGVEKLWISAHLSTEATAHPTPPPPVNLNIFPTRSHGVIRPQLLRNKHTTPSVQFQRHDSRIHVYPQFPHVLRL